MSPRTHRPVLVFQGGGYEGCIYEWNALVFNPGTAPKPEAVQPCASGRAGKRVLEAAHHGLRSAVVAARSEGDWHLCTTSTSWIKFDDEFNKGFVRGVCKAAHHECRCDRCIRWFDPDEIVHLGYRGNGGIGVQFDDNHCLECAEEEHDAYCAKFLWKYEFLASCVEAIQRHNEESLRQVNRTAAADREEPAVILRDWAILCLEDGKLLLGSRLVADAVRQREPDSKEAILFGFSHGERRGTVY